MQVETTPIAGLRVVTPKVFGDDRGFFVETYHEARYREAGIPGPFVQDNHSRSSRGVLRGLHFQVTQPQAKLVSAIEGTILDVVVDVRRGSPTFGQSFGVELSAENKKQLYVPRGFAHGFCVLSETAQVTYKCDAPYAAGDEGGLRYDDPELGITWPISEVQLSEKDKAWAPLKAARLPEVDYVENSAK